MVHKGDYGFRCPKHDHYHNIGAGASRLRPPFIVKCDVSTYGFGAVLLQDKHPIAFFNRPVATSAPLPSFI